MTLDIERSDLERLKLISKDRGESVSSLIRRAVKSFLRRQKGPN